MTIKNTKILYLLLHVNILHARLYLSGNFPSPPSLYIVSDSDFYALQFFLFGKRTNTWQKKLKVLLLSLAQAQIFNTERNNKI